MYGKTSDSFKAIILIKPKLSAVLIMFILASASVEALGITTAIPLLTSLFGDGQTGWEPEFLLALNLSQKAQAYLLASVVGAAFLLKAAILTASSWIMARAMSGYSADVRKSYMRKLSQADIQHLNSSTIGTHIAILGTDSIRATTAYITCFRFTAFLVQTLLFTGYAIFLSIEVALLAFVGGGILVIGLRKLVSMSRSAGTEMTSSTHSMSTIAAQAIRGMTDFRSMASESFLINQVVNRSNHLKTAHFKTIFSGQLMRALQEPIIIICAMLALILMHFSVKMDVATIILVAGIFYRLLQSVSALQNEYQRFVTDGAAVHAVMNGIDALAKKQESQLDQKAILNDCEDVSISFENVVFSYSDKVILDGFTTTIPSKSTTLFFGPSGRGKSTATHLITGLLQPTRGAVYVNGTDLATLSRPWWRQKLGYLGQTPFFFSGTIAENIDVGRQVDPQIVKTALDRCNCKKFIADLPNGIDTIMQEGGANFSGGQIQRLALARAIAAKPAVLILDEPTSALDEESKTLIFEVIKELSKDITIIVISHDADALKHADKVVRF